MTVDLRGLIDSALEVTIVASFSSPGYRIRRRLFDWSDPPSDALEGKTALVTGPTSGLGRAAAEDMASLGARVILAGRSRERLGAVSEQLSERYRDDRFPTVVADMSSLESAREAAASVLRTEPRLDILIDSAGAIQAERTITDDGLEATFATTVVAPFVLISRLMPLLSTGTDGRVISVVSGGMYGQALDLDDLQFEMSEYNGTLAYARAKRAQTAMSREWARRLRGRGPRVNAMHPGWADTPGLAGSLPGFYGLIGPILRTAEQGVDTITWLASDPGAGSRGGQLFLDRRPRPFDRLPSTRSTAAERSLLWDRVVSLSGEPDPFPTDRQTGQ